MQLQLLNPRAEQVVSRGPIASRPQREPGRPFDTLYRLLHGEDAPRSVTRGTSAADIISRPRGFMAGFDFTMQLQVGCPGGCQFCYVQRAVRLAPPDVRDQWGFLVRDKVDVGGKLRRHLAAGGLADKTVFWSGITDPYAAAPAVTAEVWRTLAGAPARQRPRRVVVQTRFHPDRDARAMADYARETRPSDGGPPVLVSYSIGTDQDRLIRAWERATPSFRHRMETVDRLRQAALPVVVTLSPFALWDDLRGTASLWRDWGVSYLTALFFKEHADCARTPGGFLAHLRDEYPRVLDPAWQADRLCELAAVFGPGRVLVGQEAFASLAAPHRVSDCDAKG